MPRNIYGNSVTQSAMIDKLRNDIDIELADQITSITNETVARENLGSILSAAIIQEQVNRDSAISAEVTNRVTAVDTLTTSINQETVNRVSDVDMLTTTIEDSNIGNYVEESRSYITSIDSGSYVDVDGMVVTPPAGTYTVHFSLWIENDEKKADDGLEVGIYIGNTVIEHSKRRQWRVRRVNTRLLFIRRP